MILKDCAEDKKDACINFNNVDSSEINMDTSDTNVDTLEQPNRDSANPNMDTSRDILDNNVCERIPLYKITAFLSRGEKKWRKRN